MKRIWCWLGLHDWLMNYRIGGDFDNYYADPLARTCLRCNREEEWQRSREVAE